MRILIGEDEVEIARALKVLLERNRYAVDMVHTGTLALEYSLAINYDVIILDIMMPGMDGICVLQKLRAKKIATPVLMLTAKGEVEDRVAGLNAGADDYLAKPFATTEFIARVKALTRRNHGYTPEVLSLGNIQLNANTYELSSPIGELRLNNKEYQLMDLFIRNPKHIFSTNQLMERIWGFESEAEINVVWTYIANLRKKLKALEARVEIKTARGAGFSLEDRLC